jgi:hypothetical protein
LKNKILKIQTEEKVMENGLTNNSKIKIRQISSDTDNTSYEGNINIKFKFGDKTEVMNCVANNNKINFKLDSLDMLESSLKVFILQGTNEIYIDKVKVRDILDRKFYLKFTHQSKAFNISFIWINSKIIYYNKEVTVLDNKILEDKESINVLNNSIQHIEGILILILDTFKKYFNYAENTEPKLYENKNYGTTNKELEVSQKIENYILKVMGREVIIMDGIIFFLNKVIICLVMLNNLYRYDLLTVLFNINFLVDYICLLIWNRVKTHK